MIYSFRDHTPYPASYVYQHGNPKVAKLIPYRCGFRALGPLRGKDFRAVRKLRDERHLAVHIAARAAFYRIIKEVVNANK